MLLVSVDQVQQNCFKINQFQATQCSIFTQKHYLKLCHVNEMKLEHQFHPKTILFWFLDPFLPICLVEQHWADLVSSVFLHSKC